MVLTRVWDAGHADVDGLVGWAAALVDDLTACAEISPPRLRPALRKPY
ncbi:MAG: hypothetical protein QOI01_7315 [Mycobacterium sp.]|jgi:hypothetical protein|nr:hypothetical protein [Mycobacterium sp.]